MRKSGLPLCAAAAIVIPGNVRADLPPAAPGPAAPEAPGASLEQAKMYFNAGAQAYSAGRYEVAIAAFGQAYRQAPRPAILFSMAQAERKEWYVGRKADVIKSAVRHYRDYLAQVPTGGRRTDATDALAELEPAADRLAPTADAPAPSRPTGTQIMITSPISSATVTVDGAEKCEVPLMQAVAPGRHKVVVSAPGYFDEQRDVVALAGTVVPSEISLREKPAELTIATDAVAEVSVDGRVLARTPLARPIELPSGAHFIAITRNGYKLVARTVTVERDQAVRLDVHFEPSRQRVTSLVMLGASAVTLAAGGAFAGAALVQQSNAQQVLNEAKTGNIAGLARVEYDQAITLRDSWRTAAAATLGVGAAALAVGALLYYLDAPVVGAVPPASHEGAPPKPREMEMSLVPALGPGMVGAAWGGRF